ncbi:MAG: VOC family protein [Gemmatimonadota bacterium]|nr:VOC family protein [Gemmatimonadota bacterium]
MITSLDHISAISLFVEDLGTTKDFYREVFAAKLAYEDDVSAAFSFGSVVVNLLRIDRAPEIIAPGHVATRESGSRMQLSVWLDDVDAACKLLERHGVELLTGPRDRPWGMRTATFVDPAGHNWEIAQRISAQ